MLVQGVLVSPLGVTELSLPGIKTDNRLSGVRTDTRRVGGGRALAASPSGAGERFERNGVGAAA
jgi:hypothetical protein